MEGANSEKKEISQPSGTPADSSELFIKAGKKEFARKYRAGLIVLILLGAFFFFWKVSGLRVDVFAERIKYKTYNHIGPDFSFAYPDYFAFDADEEKKYGDSYVGGFRLKSDQRTGCDVRLSGTGLNFQKKDQEIKDALSKELSQSAKDFKMLDAGRMKIDGEPAYFAEFSFTDPLGATTRLAQVMTSHADANYLMICGTGDYQYKYFQKDFMGFLNSFRWKSKIL